MAAFFQACSNAFLIEMYEFRLSFPPKFVSGSQISNLPALVRMMAWRRSGDGPLTEPVMVSLMTHICATRPQ